MPRCIVLFVVVVTMIFICKSGGDEDSSDGRKGAWTHEQSSEERRTILSTYMSCMGPVVGCFS